MMDKNDSFEENEMMDENDSFEDEVVTLSEAIRDGLVRGASFVVECWDHDGVTTEFLLVYPTDEIRAFEKSCWRASFNVIVHDLDEIRRAEAEA